eukprot:scaffold10470_cov64-Phaeocystis_antarctica.AAC.1
MAELVRCGAAQHLPRQGATQPTAGAARARGVEEGGDRLEPAGEAVGHAAAQHALEVVSPPLPSRSSATRAPSSSASASAASASASLSSHKRHKPRAIRVQHLPCIVHSRLGNPMKPCEPCGCEASSAGRGRLPPGSVAPNARSSAS